MLAMPSSTRHTTISRALPNRSAAAPSTGWMIAKVKANTAAKLAAVRDADAKILGHMRQHRIERARRQAGSKGRERDDIEGRRQAAGCGHGCRHQARDWRWRSASNSIRRLHQRFELAQRHHVGSVRRRVIRIGVGLDEHAGNADRDRRARQHRHEFALAAGRGALPARLLHRMGGVENHRRAGRAAP